MIDAVKLFCTFMSLFSIFYGSYAAGSGPDGYFRPLDRNHAT